MFGTLDFFMMFKDGKVKVKDEVRTFEQKQ